VTISYRLSHKRASFVKPLKTGCCDGQSADNSKFVTSGPGLGFGFSKFQFWVWVRVQSSKIFKKIGFWVQVWVGFVKKYQNTNEIFLENLFSYVLSTANSQMRLYEYMFQMLLKVLMQRA
jgi:hypothetical protein